MTELVQLVLALIACVVVLVLLAARILLPPEVSWRWVPGFAVIGLDVLGRKLINWFWTARLRIAREAAIWRGEIDR